MDGIKIKDISADMFQKLESEVQQLSKSGTHAGLAALGGAAIASLLPAIGTIAAVTVIGFGAVTATNKLRRKLNIDKELVSIKNKVRDAQKQLKAEGLYQNRIDGIIGPSTQLAIKNFQSIKGLNKTGILDQTTHNELTQAGRCLQSPPRL
ncbi:MAG: peptidoglycan-binding domain-containing protein [Methylococcaceae bacterium]